MNHVKRRISGPWSPMGSSPHQANFCAVSIGHVAINAIEANIGSPTVEPSGVGHLPLNDGVPGFRPPECGGDFAPIRRRIRQRVLTLFATGPNRNQRTTQTLSDALWRGNNRFSCKTDSIRASSLMTLSVRPNDGDATVGDARPACSTCRTAFHPKVDWLQNQIWVWAEPGTWGRTMETVKDRDDKSTASTRTRTGSPTANIQPERGV